MNWVGGLVICGGITQSLTFGLRCHGVAREVSSLAYRGLLACCSAHHGDTRPHIKYTLQMLLPSVLMTCSIGGVPLVTTSTTVSKPHQIVRANTVEFLAYVDSVAPGG